MRLTIVILLAIFGLILCVNLSASTYMDWQRYRYDRSVGLMEYQNTQWQRTRQEQLDLRQKKQVDLDNCVRMWNPLPKGDIETVSLWRLRAYDKWAECEGLRMEIQQAPP